MKYAPQSIMYSGFVCRPRSTVDSWSSNDFGDLSLLVPLRAQKLGDQSHAFHRMVAPMCLWKTTHPATDGVTFVIVAHVTYHNNEDAAIQKRFISVVATNMFAFTTQRSREFLFQLS
jgi:hypothetical protein